MTHTETNPGRSSSRLLRSFAVLGLAVATMAVSFSSAYFADTDSSASEAITSGTVDIEQGVEGATIDFAYTNIAPGTDSGIQTVVVDNKGSLDLTYDAAVSVVPGVAGEEDLIGFLELVVWDEADETDATENSTCDAQPATTVYAQAAIDLASWTGETIGSNTSQTLCMIVSFPEDNTDQSAAMGQSATATFTFDAQDNLDGTLTS